MSEDAFRRQEVVIILQITWGYHSNPGVVADLTDPETLKVMNEA